MTASPLSISQSSEYGIKVCVSTPILKYIDALYQIPHLIANSYWNFLGSFLQDLFR